MSARRYSFERVEVHGGRRVAVIRDHKARDPLEELVRVYYRNGRWRRWEARYGDDGCGDVLAGIARRGLDAPEESLRFVQNTLGWAPR